MDEFLEKIYKGTSRQLFLDLKSSAHGLSQQEAEKRLNEYGKNVIQKKKKESVIKLFFKNFVSMLAILLWFAGCIAIISCFIAPESSSSIGVLKDPGMLYLGIAIFLVNIINGVFSFVQQFKANKSTEALSKMLPTYARVIRDGEEKQIEAADLTIGDIMILNEGEDLIDVLTSFSNFLENDIIIGHNVNFDINFLYDSMEENLGEALTNDYIDTLRLSRKILPTLAHHRLDDLIEYFNLNTRNLHRALNDCILTNEVYLNLCNLL